MHSCKTWFPAKLIGRECGKNITVYLGNKDSLILKINLKTVRI
jgi:hypothetical protein